MTETDTVALNVDRDGLSSVGRIDHADIVRSAIAKSSDPCLVSGLALTLRC